MERMHPARIDKYDKLATNAQKWNTASGSSVKKLNCNLTQSLAYAHMVTQKKFDNAMFSLIIDRVLPLHIVDLPEFENFISVLQSNWHSTSQAALKTNKWRRLLCSKSNGSGGTWGRDSHPADPCAIAQHSHSFLKSECKEAFH